MDGIVIRSGTSVTYGKEENDVLDHLRWEELGAHGVGKYADSVLSHHSLVTDAVCMFSDRYTFFLLCCKK